MAARKQETLNHETAGSTFWRQSSSAIPGRVKSGGRFGAAAAATAPGNAAVSIATSRGGGGAAHSFQHFQDSVSDAWEIEESASDAVGKPVPAAGKGVAAVTPSRPANEVNNAKSSNITPVHIHTQVTQEIP